MADKQTPFVMRRNVPNQRPGPRGQRPKRRKRGRRNHRQADIPEHRMNPFKARMIAQQQDVEKTEENKDEEENKQSSGTP